MVEGGVEDEAHPPLVEGGHEAIQGGVAPQRRVHRVEVGGVVVVGRGGGEHRVHVDDIHPEAGQIVGLGGDAHQVPALEPQPVRCAPPGVGPGGGEAGVAVAEALREDLVDDGAPRPFGHLEGGHRVQVQCPPVEALDGVAHPGGHQVDRPAPRVAQGEGVGEAAPAGRQDHLPEGEALGASPAPHGAARAVVEDQVGLGEARLGPQAEEDAAVGARVAAGPVGRVVAQVGGVQAGVLAEVAAVGEVGAGHGRRDGTAGAALGPGPPATAAAPPAA